MKKSFFPPTLAMIAAFAALLGNPRSAISDPLGGMRVISESAVVVSQLLREGRLASVTLESLKSDVAALVGQSTYSSSIVSNLQQLAMRIDSSEAGGVPSQDLLRVVSYLPDDVQSALLHHLAPEGVEGKLQAAQKLSIPSLPDAREFGKLLEESAIKGGVQSGAFAVQTIVKRFAELKLILVGYQLGQIQLSRIDITSCFDAHLSVVRRWLANAKSADTALSSDQERFGMNEQPPLLEVHSSDVEMIATLHSNLTLRAGQVWSSGAEVVPQHPGPVSGPVKPPKPEVQLLHLSSNVPVPQTFEALSQQLRIPSTALVRIQNDFPQASGAVVAEAAVLMGRYQRAPTRPQDAVRLVRYNLELIEWVMRAMYPHRSDLSLHFRYSADVSKPSSPAGTPVSEPSVVANPATTALVREADRAPASPAPSAGNIRQQVELEEAVNRATDVLDLAYQLNRNYSDSITAILTLWREMGAEPINPGAAEYEHPLAVLIVDLPWYSLQYRLAAYQLSVESGLPLDEVVQTLAQEVGPEATRLRIWLRSVLKHVRLPQYNVPVPQYGSAVEQTSTPKGSKKKQATP